MAEKPRNLALVFGGGSDAAPEGGPSGDADDMAEPDTDLDALAGEMTEGEDAEADAPPPDFATHATEAFPELSGDDARIEALYRTIKSCHPVV